MITSNNEPDLDYGGPLNGQTYQVTIASDGEKAVILDAPAEVHWYLAEFGNYPEDHFESPCITKSGVWKCWYMYDVSTRGIELEQVDGFKLVTKDRIL